MLVRGRVVDDIRVVEIHDLGHFVAVTDGTDNGRKPNLGIVLSDLKLDVVGVVLIHIADDQMLWAMRRNLSA